MEVFRMLLLVLSNLSAYGIALSGWSVKLAAIQFPESFFPTLEAGFVPPTPNIQIWPQVPSQGSLLDRDTRTLVLAAIRALSMIVMKQQKSLNSCKE